MTRLRSGSATDVGRVRAVNEDALHVEDDYVAVADGMGGHRGGEVASRLAIEELHRGFDERTVDSLLDVVQAANTAIIEEAEADSSLRGMGTTLVIVAVIDNDGEARLAVVNVGDSRCYLFVGGGLRQITSDHTVVQTLVDHGEISEADAEHHPHRNVVTRALGIDKRVMTDYWELQACSGDRYLLCSDGLTGELSDTEIAGILRGHDSPGDAASELVTRANEAGGHDNVTVIVVDVVESEGHGADSGGRVLATVDGTRQAIDAGEAEVAARAAPAGEEGPDEAEERRKTRRPGFRALLVAVVLIAVLLTVVASVVFAGRNTFYVGFDGDEVVVFEGRPGGVLWMDPSVDARTAIFRVDVPASYLDELQEGKQFGNREEASAYVDRIRAEIEDEEPTPAPAPVSPTSEPDEEETEDPVSDGEDTTSTTDGTPAGRGQVG